MSEFETNERKGSGRRMASMSTQVPREKAILVGVERTRDEWPIESSLAELERLAYTAGADVVAKTTQKLTKPNPATFVGSGKVQEIAELAHKYDADIIIFDDELTPTQQSNLERSVDRHLKVIDRTALILDIFALHAKTKEGRLQVRLAQNQYLYPRLRGMWAHLASNRMGGGVGSRFGEGESQLEVDRRIVRSRITSIKRELKKLKTYQAQQREVRYSSGIFKVALVGYTNAGKSSFLNKLCEADVYSDDLLFATLDSTSRKFMLPQGREIVLSDTVGFIQKLPTTLIEAFNSTLYEISASDLLLHIVDVSSDDFERQIDAVYKVIDQISASDIPRLLVFNKIDLLNDNEIASFRRRFSDAYFVSSITGEGLDELVDSIAVSASSADVSLNLKIPYEKGSMVSLAHRKGKIISEKYTDNGVLLSIRIPNTLKGLFKKYEV